MQKLLSLKLENFQCHGSLTVSFSPTITTIKGPSDVGKSSILRALNWVCLNNIAGDEFIKEGEKETAVTLTVGDGKTQSEIVRLRGPHTNTYQLDEKDYKSFGQDVPIDIAAILELNNINFQNQHDSPFWFNESAPEVSRRLNAVVDLSVIDTALSNIASAVRRAQEKVAFVEERINEAALELEKLEPQRDRIEEFKSLKEEHDEYTGYKERYDRLAAVLTRGRECRDRQRTFEEKAIEGRGVLETLREVLDLSTRSSELVALVEDIGSLQAIKPPPDFGPVKQLESELTEAEVKWEELGRLYKRIITATGAASDSGEQLRLIEKRFHEQTKGRTCPLCGKTI